MPLKDISPEAVESLLNSPDWQRRLEEARAQREKVLAEKARIEGQNTEQVAPKRPWEREVPAPARRPRQTVNREAAAAARAEILLPEVMRATRAQSAEVRPVETARVVPLPQKPQPEPRSATQDVAVPPVQRRAPIGSGIQRVSERITFGAPVAAPAMAPLPAATALTPDILNPSVQAPAAVPPLVAVDPVRRRPLPLLLAVAFAAGAVIGGGIFLWFGHPAVQSPAVSGATIASPIAGMTRTTAPTTPSVSPPKAPIAVPDPIAKAVAGGEPQVQARLAAQLAPWAPDAAPATVLPVAMPFPQVDMTPAPLGSPSVSDRPAEVLHAGGISSGSPVAVSGLGAEDRLDIAFPRLDAQPARVAVPRGFSFSDTIVDRLPDESALPSVPGVAGRLGALTFASDAGEALSFPLPEASAMPGRISHPEMGNAVEDADSNAAAIADPAVFQTAAPLPVLVGTSFPGLTIRMLKSTRATDAAVSELSRRLTDNGFVRPSEKPLKVKINTSHVRFYHDADAAAAQAIAKTLEIGVQQFAPPGSAATPGTIEVWVGTSQSQATVASSATKASPPSKARKSASSAAQKRRQAERDQMRALRDRIVQQLRDGVQQ